MGGVVDIRREAIVWDVRGARHLELRRRIDDNDEWDGCNSRDELVCWKSWWMSGRKDRTCRNTRGAIATTRDGKRDSRHDINKGSFQDHAKQDNPRKVLYIVVVSVMTVGGGC